MASASRASCEARWLWSLFALAVALRAAYAFGAARIDWPDSYVYYASGLSLLANGRVNFDQVMPLYPALIALAGWRGILVVQVLAGSALVFVVHALASTLTGDRRAARLAAALMAVEPVSIFFTAQRLTETTFTVVFALALLALQRARPVAGAVLLATSLLIRPTLDLLAPVLVAWAAFSVAPAPGGPAPGVRDGLRRAARWLAIYAAAYVVLLAPWWLHNERVYGQFVRLNLGAGLVLRTEHNPVFVRYGFDWPRLRPVLREFEGVDDPVRRSAAYEDAALAFIRDDPMRYARLAARRLVRFWSLRLDQDDPFAPRPVRLAGAASTLLSFTGVAAWLLVGPERRRRLRASALLLLPIAYFTAVHVALHALVRYRFPLTPVLVALAGGGLALLSRRLLPASRPAARRSSTNAAYSRSREAASGSRSRNDG